MTHAETVTHLMNETSFGDPLVLEAQLNNPLNQDPDVSSDVALRIALLQLKGARIAIRYLGEQMDKLSLPR